MLLLLLLSRFSHVRLCARNAKFKKNAKMLVLTKIRLKKILCCVLLSLCGDICSTEVTGLYTNANDFHSICMCG